MKNSNVKIIILAALVLVTAGYLYLQARKTSEYGVNIILDNKDLKEIKFTGEVAGKKRGCEVDGICSYLVGNFEVIWGQGWPTAPRGFMDEHIGIGDRIEVYGHRQGENIVTIYGSEKFYIKKITGQTACTTEAKVCPDGTMVGRVAPSCEFLPCPEAKDSVPPPPIESVTAGWKIYQNNELGYEFSYPEECVKGDESAPNTFRIYCSDMNTDYEIIVGYTPAAQKQIMPKLYCDYYADSDPRCERITLINATAIADWSAPESEGAGIIRISRPTSDITFAVKPISASIKAKFKTILPTFRFIR